MIAFSDTAMGIAALALVIIVGLVLNRSMKGEFRGVKVQLGSLDKAVNQREHGAPTISQDVAEIRATTSALRSTTEAVHELVAEGVLPRLSAVEATVVDLSTTVAQLTQRVVDLEQPPAPPPAPEEAHGPAQPTPAT